MILVICLLLMYFIDTLNYTNKLNNIILFDSKHFSLYCIDCIYIYLFLKYNT